MIYKVPKPPMIYCIILLVSSVSDLIPVEHALKPLEEGNLAASQSDAQTTSADWFQWGRAALL